MPKVKTDKGVKEEPSQSPVGLDVIDDIEDNAPQRHPNEGLLAEVPKASNRKGPRPVQDEPAAAVKRPLIQAAEVVIGRYYEVTYKDGKKIVGQLVEIEGGNIQFIEPWIEGKAMIGDKVKTNFTTRDVREISREAAFELSHSHLFE